MPDKSLSQTFRIRQIGLSEVEVAQSGSPLKESYGVITGYGDAVSLLLREPDLLLNKWHSLIRTSNGLKMSKGLGDPVLKNAILKHRAL
jgi:hypothetical protein